MNSSFLLLGIAPGLIICYYIYYRDKYDKEPHQFLIKSFLLGVLSTIPAVFLEEAGQSLGLADTSTLFRTAIFAFLVVGFSEELVKFIILRFYNYPHKEFDEPYDGIIYAIMIGMGFACLENVFYIFQYGAGTGIVRAFTAVPAHGAFAVIMGYYVGLAKFEPSKATQYNLMGLGGAILFHGLYDFFLFQEDYPSLTVLAFVTLIIAVILSFKMIKIHSKNSPHRPENMPEIIVADSDDSNPIAPNQVDEIL